MRNKDNSKETAILKTTLSLIEEVGLAGLKMSELAKRAGVATGTLYIYYQSKEALITNLFNYVIGQISFDIMKDISPVLPIKDQVRQVSRNYLGELIIFPQYKIFIEQYMRSPYSQEADKCLIPASNYLEPIKHIVAKGAEAGMLKLTDPALLINLCRGSLENYAAHICGSTRQIDEKEFDKVFNFIWDGISIHEYA